jgi:hypothetical protein
MIEASRASLVAPIIAHLGQLEEILSQLEWIILSWNSMYDWLDSPANLTGGLKSALHSVAE